MTSKPSNRTEKTVDAGPSGFVFQFPYSADLVDAIKAIEGRRYNPTTKTWKVPPRKVDDIGGIAMSVLAQFAREGLRESSRK